MIQTERLLIRPWNESDVQAYLTLSTDIGYNCFSPPGIYLVKDEVEALAKIKERMHKYALNRAGKFPIFLRGSDEFVGTCGFDPYTIEGKPEFELGYRLVLRHWGKGYATEAACAVVDHGFKVLDRLRLFAFALKVNKPSIEVIQRLGFQPIGKIFHFGLDHELFAQER
jgi:RimJ/RimL family protein N-acetyltransferase